MSPYLLKIEQELKVVHSHFQWGELLAKKAAYLAREGNFDKAEEVIREVRQKFGDGHSGRVTIWIMLAESMVYHYRTLDIHALDRIKRAILLSDLMNERQLKSIAAAWRAHYEFDHSEFNGVFESLKLAINSADSNNLQSLARISNVVCKIAYLCGEIVIGRKYFSAGVTSAQKEGDQASIEAMQHNRAAFRLAHMRVRNCFAPVSATDIAEIRTEVATARSLQNLMAIKSLSEYVDLSEARILILEERFDEANRALAALCELDAFPSGTLISDSLNIERAYCLCRIGRFAEAFELYGRSDAQKLLSLDIDELVVLRWLQLQLAISDVRFGQSSSRQTEFDASVSRYHKFLSVTRSKLLAICCDFDEKLFT